MYLPGSLCCELNTKLRLLTRTAQHQSCGNFYTERKKGQRPWHIINHYFQAMLNLTEQQKLDWKQQLKDACITVLQDRIQTIEQAIEDAQEAAKGEEKSSAGDKYETSRAMAHLNSEMNARQLQQAREELATLLALNTSVILSQVATGAVVVGKENTYFIALGLGRTTINGQKITLLSPLAPIAAALLQKKAGDTVLFNGKTEEIVEIF